MLALKLCIFLIVLFHEYRLLKVHSLATVSHAIVKFNLEDFTCLRLKGSSAEILHLIIQKQFDDIAVSPRVYQLATISMSKYGIIRNAKNLTQLSFNVMFNAEEVHRKLCFEILLEHANSTKQVGMLLCSSIHKHIVNSQKAWWSSRRTLSGVADFPKTNSSYFVFVDAILSIECSPDYYGCDCMKRCISQSNRSYCDNMGRQKCHGTYFPDEGVVCPLHQITDIVSVTSAKYACTIRCISGTNNIKECDECGYVVQCDIGYAPNILRTTCSKVTCGSLLACPQQTRCIDEIQPNNLTGGFYSCLPNFALSKFILSSATTTTTTVPPSKFISTSSTTTTTTVPRITQTTISQSSSYGKSQIFTQTTSATMHSIQISTVVADIHSSGTENAPGNTLQNSATSAVDDKRKTTPVVIYLVAVLLLIMSIALIFTIGLTVYHKWNRNRTYYPRNDVIIRAQAVGQENATCSIDCANSE